MNQSIETLAGAIALFTIVAAFASVVTEGLGQADYFLPTYDNSMLHAGRARVITDTGGWAEDELVFGGVTKSYHLPLYPALVAGFSGLSGLNLWWTIRILSLLITGVLLPLSFFVLASRVHGHWMAGAVSAVVALSLPNLMTWGSRTSPISLGVLLSIVLIYLLIEKKFIAALLAGVALAYTHQPSLLVFGLTLAIAFIAIGLDAWQKGKKANEVKTMLLPYFVVGGIVLSAYLLWHVRQTGTSCLDFQCLPHLASHEYGSSVNLSEYFSLAGRIVSLGGIIILFLSKRFEWHTRLILFSWLAALVLLVKNDLLGLAVFTVRFTTFFDCALAVCAGVFVAELYLFVQQRIGDYASTRTPSSTT